MASKELIEKVARGFARRWIGADKWHVLSEEGRELYRGDARVAISTILAALQEPTPAMQLVVSANWGRRTWAEYQQVLNASPLGEQSE